MTLTETALKNLIDAFFATDPDLQTVHLAVCCDRAYIGHVPATACRTCKGTPKMAIVPRSYNPAEVLRALVS